MHIKDAANELILSLLIILIITQFIILFMKANIFRSLCIYAGIILTTICIIAIIKYNNECMSCKFKYMYYGRQSGPFCLRVDIILNKFNIIIYEIMSLGV